MGKKKNKKKEQDFFNMSVEEQMANADLFHDVEKGEVSILDALNYKVPVAMASQSDYKRQIERVCFGIDTSKKEVIESNEEDDAEYTSELEAIITHKTSDEEVSEEPQVETKYMSYSSFMASETRIKEEPETSIEDVRKELETVGQTLTTNHQEKPVEVLNKIKFNYNSIIGKMFIDDGFVNTPISVLQSASIVLDPDHIPDDTDGITSLISRIYFFIITCKHPAVIMSEDTFEIEFSLFSKINFNKFVFFKNNGFVYAYIIEPEEVNNFYSVVDILNMDDEDTLRYVVGSAYAANTIHNAFIYHDEDEVDAVMCERHNIKALIKMIENDKDTEYSGHNASGDVLSRMKVRDLQTFADETRDLLEDLLLVEEDDVEDTDNDEDDVEETVEETEEDYTEDEDLDDVDINDFPDIDMTTDTDDIDAIMERIEPTETIVAKKETVVTEKTIQVTNQSSTSSDMVLPIIHRRS